MPNNPPVPDAYVPDPPNTQWSSVARYNTGNVVGPASGGGGIAEAPTDGKMYGRVSASWGRAVNVAGDTLTGQLNLYEFNILAQAFVGDSVSLQSRTATNAARWTVTFLDGSVAESGGDTGSNFNILRFHDAGGAPAKCLTIIRATGVVSLNAGLNLQPATNAAPADGDLWYDGTHLNFRHGGTTTALV